MVVILFSFVLKKISMTALVMKTNCCLIIDRRWSRCFFEVIIVAAAHFAVARVWGLFLHCFMVCLCKDSPIFDGNLPFISY